MNIRRAYINALIVVIMAGTLWAAPSAEAVVINYRSIGTNNAELFNTGAASVGLDQVTVTFTDGPLPDTVGRGDEIVIDDEELYILSRDSDTQVTLQTPALKEHKATRNSPSAGPIPPSSPGSMTATETSSGKTAWRLASATTTGRLPPGSIGRWPTSGDPRQTGTISCGSRRLRRRSTRALPAQA